MRAAVLAVTIALPLAPCVAAAQSVSGPTAAGPVPPTAPAPSIHDPADVRPAAPMPADALIPGGPGVHRITCNADAPPTDGSGALGAPTPAATPPRRVHVDNPWADRPRMTGVDGPVDVTLFKRGRTLIFDAGDEVLYVDRDRRKFTYTKSGAAGVTMLRGTCRAGD